MQDKLLEHIRLLSDSHMEPRSALQVFAQCFDAIYGRCSFMSLALNAEQGQRVRLVFHSDYQQAEQIESYLEQNKHINITQLNEIVATQMPQLVNRISAELASLLNDFHLPTRSMMAIPLFLDGVIQRWVLVLGELPNQFSDVNLNQAMLLANLANTYMARIEETLALAQANDWIEKELADIGRIHQLLLPQTHCELKGTQMATYFSSCDRAGGDYYDIVCLTELFDPGAPEDRPDIWGAILADASGHGAAAAVEIAMFDAILRTYKGTVEAGPANVFNYTNKYFFTRMGRGSFITAVILNYDPVTKILNYANAGHPPIILVSPDGQLRELVEHCDIPLGIQQDWVWQNASLQVEHGAVLIAYTDGITEALSPSKKQFGYKRLEEIVRRTQGGSAQDYKQAIISELHAHQADHPQNDDQALLVVKLLD